MATDRQAAPDKQEYDAEHTLPLAADDLTAEHYWLTERTYRLLRRGGARLIRVHQLQKCAKDRCHAKQTKRLHHAALRMLMQDNAGDLVWCKRCVGVK